MINDANKNTSNPPHTKKVIRTDKKTTTLNASTQHKKTLYTAILRTTDEEKGSYSAKCVFLLVFKLILSEYFYEIRILIAYTLCHRVCQSSMCAAVRKLPRIIIHIQYRSCFTCWYCSCLLRRGAYQFFK